MEDLILYLILKSEILKSNYEEKQKKLLKCYLKKFIYIYSLLNKDILIFAMR